MRNLKIALKYLPNLVLLGGVFFSKYLFNNSNVSVALALNAIMMALTIMFMLKSTNKENNYDLMFAKNLKKFTSDLFYASIALLSTHSTIVLSVIIISGMQNFIDFSAYGIIEYISIMLPVICFLWAISLIGQAAETLIELDNNTTGGNHERAQKYLPASYASTRKGSAPNDAKLGYTGRGQNGHR